MRLIDRTLKERLIKDLKNKQELDPDLYDGSYQLIRETISAYFRLRDYSELNYRDLNLVYLMIIGTWRHSINKKKEAIENSHLPDESKMYLKKVIDDVWMKAQKGMFLHVEGEEACVGMFGTGFYSFENKTQPEFVRAFIAMCVELLNETDDEKCFDTASSVLTMKKSGLQAASASAILHCLKPMTFPVLNGNMNYQNAFSVMGVSLKKKESIHTYIDNCRRIKAFRDEHFHIRNYRIFDMEDCKIPGYKEEIMREIAETPNLHLDTIETEDDFRNFKIFEILNMCFGKSYRGYMKAWYDINENYAAWFPIMLEGDYEGKNPKEDKTWINALSSDGKVITEVNYSHEPYQYQEGKIEKNRLVFGKFKDGIRFLGVFEDMRDVTQENYHNKKYRRVATEVDLNNLIGESKGVDDQMDLQKEHDGIEQTGGFGHNILLYGPPGTGKTYNTVIYAVAICDGLSREEVAKRDYRDVLKRYKALKREERVAFTTFHQSYGYEEFIEGIRPVLEEDEGGLEYALRDGMFKAFCNKAVLPEQETDENKFGLNASPNVWKISLCGSGDNPVRSDCMENSYIRLGYNDVDPSDMRDKSKQGWSVVNAFANKMQIGDIVFSCYSEKTIDAIGVVTGNYEKNENFSDYQHVRHVRWLVKGINEDIFQLNKRKNLSQVSCYKMKISKENALHLIEELRPDVNLEPQYDKPYVFIIDEINRGNISKIFGELITLIEESKRAGMPEAVSAVLPYSGEEFSVPKNVYILGTMNTADRSIAIMDTALRRRFCFEEMMPQTELLKDIRIKADGIEIDIERMVSVMNARVEYLFDREHTIGHAYFIALRQDPSIKKLGEIFSMNVIPLLQEYFYEDYEKIRLVLGDNAKEEGYQFITCKRQNPKDIFKGTGLDLDECVKYEIDEEAFEKAQSYLQIYM